MNDIAIGRELELLRKIESLLIEREKLQQQVDYVRIVLDECKDDFHICERCGEQDDEATKTSNLWLMLDHRLNPK